MGRRNRATQLPTNLPALQNLIKRDPQSYREEFLLQLQHYESSLAILRLEPDGEAKEFSEQVTFLSHVTSCYPRECEAFPDQLISLLQEHHLTLNAEVRRTLVQAVILLRNRQVISTIGVLELFFTLFRCRDKALRSMLYAHIITDIRNANAKSRDNKMNKVLQNYMYTLLEQADQGAEQALAAKKAIEVCVELYRRRVWSDPKTVDILAQACFSKVNRISLAGIQFFLGIDEDRGAGAGDSDSDGEGGTAQDIRKLQHAAHVGGKSKTRTRKMDKAVAAVRRRETREKRAEVFHFSALHQLRDPQGFAERLYHRVSTGNAPIDVRILEIKLLARVIGVHKLVLLPFYSYILRYLQPHQRDVTALITAVAQASHEMVPPDSLEPVLMALANNFVVDTVAPEVVSAGLNGIREVCTRAPLAMTETLLQDLTEYKSHRNKGECVMMASRGLIGLFRQLNPELLKRKDRGKSASMGLKNFKTLGYGEINVADQVDGMDLLEGPQSEEEEGGDNPGEGWEGWEIASDEDEEEDGEEEVWTDVLNGEEEDDKGEEDVQESEEKAKPAETLRFLSEEDFRKIRRRKQRLEAEKLAGIIGHRKKARQSYEERLESIREGREGRVKYGSKKGKERGSTTNREKAKKKAFMMVVHKNGIFKKSRLSLREKQIHLRKHIDRQKKQM
ncbi:SDA1-domain-containing protein [Piptocephalis cylindrospora]|uniref:Protein SDA1 n=1 Tax=Piptocephalis cylindrospora TaxID=1907219 RepID=A0A4P9Y4H1_9FUNG|nr:SDA1-domain-containing protein [Piptocephalis cylindrospora]|eukprot:RKP13562.1 SDA1-domain-containing protein [Piptocephalis cylindrospora]